MQLTFTIASGDLDEFVQHWSGRYSYSAEHKYDQNIGRPLTEKSRQELFEWKNGTGGKISAPKMRSILQNYPLNPPSNLEERYLTRTDSGGAIWNIFYLHCINRDAWPIFDQHTYRAMRYMQDGVLEEIGSRHMNVFEQYAKYRNFFAKLNSYESRKLDKALFSFGRFLKLASPYI